MVVWIIAITTLVMSLAFGVFFATTAYGVLFGAPFLPTDKRNLDHMIALSELKPGDRFADLGSGDGRLVIAAAKTGAKAEGWEINPYLWLLARARAVFAGVGSRAEMRLGSYWWENFSGYDVISLYLIDMQMPRMERKLQAELAPGARIVSHVFKFPNWKPVEKRGSVYLYKR
ncbi:hypothetical protein HY633_05230 [Candidatus Uhrbacteria bacterium]|nr:hypothetical protein [Candidatus Uhrbacteria bacterium]